MLIFSRYTWWVGAMLGLTVFLTAAGQVGVLHPVQGAFLVITRPAEELLTSIFRPIAGFLSDAGSISDLREENRRLRLENEELRTQSISLQTDAERVKQLEEALKISQGAANEQYLAANVVHRDSSAFTDVISIDRGSNSGVRVGMVVLSSQGSLMGTVTEVFGSRSFVRLITDSKSKVAAQVQASQADGIVKGAANRTLTFDLAQADIKVGDIIVTSALTGRYPAGLPIGKVTDVSGTQQDLFRKVTLEPFVRLSTASTVLVQTSFIPQGLLEAGD